VKSLTLYPWIPLETIKIAGKWMFILFKNEMSGQLLINRHIMFACPLTDPHPNPVNLGSPHAPLADLLICCGSRMAVQVP
jgi:hypothetical protein